MPPTSPLADLLATGAPFALLSREGVPHLDLLTADPDGPLTVSALAEIPLPDGPGPRTLALVPYRQISERGFACVDDGTPLSCLRLTGHHRLTRDDVLATLPDEPAKVTDGGFDIGDDEYAEIVSEVLREEIGHGEGANFVIHRTYTAQLGGDPLRSAAAALRRMLLGERGAYWTFLVHTGGGPHGRILVGATPERHVSVDDGLVTMNPISGTFRRPAGQPNRAALLDFLADPKEINELYMVLDEELKMMATVADRGGQVIGPYLKEMAHLIHTEYLLAGRGGLDVREVLRETMFAPTVTGSPIENACRVIARHERRGRGYYAGVLALLGNADPGGAGPGGPTLRHQTLDAPILIRFADVDRNGQLRVSVGATLVRDSTPAGEVAETHTKAAGVLTGLGLRGDAAGGTPGRDAAAIRFADDPEVRAALSARNDRLARFWLEQRDPPATAAHRVLVVDAEDTFTGMLVHQLRSLGMDTTLRPWDAVGDVTGFDLVVPGPGPGDPTDPADPKMAALRTLIRDLLRRGQPTLAVCLSHQVLAARLGLTMHRRVEPYQGVPREIDLFGQRRRVGYYASFTALAPAFLPGGRLDTRYGRVEICHDPDDRAVHALRGATFAGVQFHPESVLTEQGPAILTDLIGPLMTGHHPEVG